MAASSSSGVKVKNRILKRKVDYTVRKYYTRDAPSWQNSDTQYPYPTNQILRSTLDFFYMCAQQEVVKILDHLG